MERTHRTIKNTQKMSTDAHTYHNLKPLNSGHGQVKSSLLKLIRREPEVVSEVINEHRGHDDDHTPPTVTDRISSVLRQVLATVMIFGVFFVIVNWGAISQIVSWEYEKVTTNADTTNPLYGLLDTKAAKEDLLPLTKSAADAKNQIPALALSVAPPDTRLIIPRINRNVPVINVSTESLLKKRLGTARERYAAGAPVWSYPLSWDGAARSAGKYRRYGT
jgi:hypothetical protein